MFRGRVVKASFDVLLSHLEEHLAGWKIIYLSLAGHLTLVKSVLTTLPYHGNVGDHHHVPIVKWETVTPMDQGGLGVRTYRIMNDAFLMKLGWKLLSDDGALWCSVLRNKDIAGLRGLNHMELVRPYLGDQICLMIEAMHLQSNVQSMDVYAWKATPNGCFSVKLVHRSIGGFGSAAANSKWVLLWKLLQVKFYLSRVGGFGDRGMKKFLEINSSYSGVSKSIINVAWKFPASGWVKLNVDGAYKGNPGRGGGGGFLRDDGGRWLKDFVLHSGTCNSMLAEISALLFGLQLAWDSGYRKV
ncbi:hypothetical protein GH714_013348 [Hevea brasiliensis]|uniref:RNase H type-1 domain-containing protein n=1 Tax=Hevea brasiliensis TaxID=3981 RepID=A0A6A6N4L9_HEVBR|nr:hypothetical protein GH714_013348 [Hevea brasiliensis]